MSRPGNLLDVNDEKFFAYFCNFSKATMAFLLTAIVESPVWCLPI